MDDPSDPTSDVTRNDADVSAPVEDPAPRSSSRLERGDEVGRYVVLERVGSGGMGVVYAAYDPELDRKVALKLLGSRRKKSGPASTGQRRLIREAQAMARLSHPNVIAVHDVGTFRSHVFVAMEFVEGETLSRWREVSPRNWREVLEVMMAAGEGLAAAHAGELVHRDFKPDNVMIGTDGRVRVLDFGLARARGSESQSSSTSSLTTGEREPTDVHRLPSTQGTLGSTTGVGERLTRTGAVLGTPAYMSPEQHAGLAADERSDQFSFCVTAYELLYGERPFAGGTSPALVLAIAEGRVSAAPEGSDVPTWVRSLVVRGLAGTPEERHPTMGHLLAALRAGLAPSRRSSSSRIALLFGGIAALGLGAAVWVASARAPDPCADIEDELVGIWDEATRQTIAEAFEGTKLRYANDVWSRVEPRFDAFAETWIAGRRNVCEAKVRAEQSPELVDRRLACLERARARVAAFVDVLAAADETVVENAVAGASTLPEPAVCDDLERLLADVDPPTDPAAVARWRAERDRLAALQKIGKPRDAEPDADALVSAAESLEYGPVLAEAYYLRGGLWSELGKEAEALADLEAAYVQARRSGADEPGYRAAIGLVSQLGLREHADREARVWAEIADAELERAGRLQTPDEADLLAARAHVAREAGEYQEAIDFLREAIAIRTATSGPSDPAIAKATGEIASCLVALGDFDAGRAEHERAVAMAVEALGPNHPVVARSLHNFAGLYSREGKHDEARAMFERSIEIMEKGIGPTHPSLAIGWSNYAAVLTDLEDWEAAKVAHDRALKVLVDGGNEDHEFAGTVHNNIGVYLQAKHDDAAALAEFQRSLEVSEAHLGKDHIENIPSMVNVGSTLTNLERWDEAEVYLLRAQKVIEDKLGPEHPYLTFVLHPLGDVAFARGDHAGAIALLERKIVLIEKSGFDPVERGRARVRLAEMLEAGGREDEAVQILEAARPDLEGVSDGENIDVLLRKWGRTR